MKQKIWLVAGLLAVLLGTVPVFAQTQMKVQVPFDFLVGNRSLPAGDYHLASMATGQALSIQNADGKHAILVIVSAAESLDRSAASKLVFHRYNGTYFLKQVWYAGESRGRELPTSSAEAEMAKSARVPDVVALKALP